MRIPKKVKVVLSVICAVMLTAAIAIFVFRVVDGIKERKAFEEKSNQLRYSEKSYKFNIIGSLEPSDANFDGYIPLEQYGSFYIADNSLMLEQTLELTFNSAIDYGYYIKNECFSCDTDDEYHYYFFGSEKSFLPFYLKISPEWDKAHWFIRADYQAPETRLNVVKEILIADSDETNELLSNSLQNNDLRRIEPRNQMIITDREMIENWVERYKNKSYVYGDGFDEIAQAKRKSTCGYILAGFEDEPVYQVIGTY